MEITNQNPVGEQLDNTTLGTAVHLESEGDSSSGSPYGKFNNANDLLNAYNNLQSEFTRKCQRLSELEKQSSCVNATEEVQDAPQYTLPSWQEQIGEFLQQHPDAQNFASDIANEIYSDKALSTNPRSLELAYGRILAKKYKSDEELARDPQFLDKYIYSNPDITSKVLDNYLKDFAATPHLITSKVGASTGMAPNKGASNLSEARKMVERLFK